MTFDDELTLISPKDFTDDAIGNQIPVDPTETTILCGVKSVTRSEHYAAAADGLKPEVVFIVNRYEYAGQKNVKHNSKPYRVIRTYQPDKAKAVMDFENIELVCQGGA